VAFRDLDLRWVEVDIAVLSRCTSRVAIGEAEYSLLALEPCSLRWTSEHLDPQPSSRSI